MARDTFSVPQKRHYKDIGESDTTNDNEGSITETPSISLPASADIVSTYITMIYAKVFLFPSHVFKFDQILELKEICDMLDTTKWNDKLRERLELRAPSEPWRAFRYAAQQGDLKMAKIAIEHFEQEPQCPASLWPKVSLKDFEGIPEAWTFELCRLRATLEWRDGPSKGPLQRSLRYLTWEKIAQMFNPTSSEGVSANCHF